MNDDDVDSKGEMGGELKIDGKRDVFTLKG
jgi:hypothetical protein